ncbi:GGDEF domain-containing protein [Psychrobium sp. 1_MG-2023]|uniref:GGDEF domain-containing protein n=1 Tax=Psychrobium sp. 1_MG-2023 TaxID=3062624 RepID=UPI0026D095C4|nr:GGDEF domain-containing protein [Psychrobium sp. 1_MG-2023]MDP2559978.1 GGDEF domain-containing protein [Psychrobium sp. 1_MG-2023]
MQRLNLKMNEVEDFEFTSIVKELSDNLVSPIRRAVDKLQFLEKLNTTVELQPMLAIYAGEVGLRLPVSGIEFKVDQQHYQLKYSSASRFALNSELTFANKPLGEMIYLSTKPLNQQQRQIIASFEQQLLQPLNNVLIFEQNRLASLRDYLTGLGNRSYFEETLNQMTATAVRDRRSFTLLMLDLDNFKQVNDQHGHSEGDKVLKQFAMILKDALRSNDHVFRFGGDEFSLLLAHSDELNPTLVAHRILKAVRNDPLLAKHEITTSIGFSNWSHKDCNKTLLERADAALYHAKSRGKNTYHNADNE